ncbi:PqiC family protein [Muricoccus nepalensis]|uniref:PqiC family protein n=1 Tax=Muricoccus nepalensis TaxID=1854500 RepID=UPI0013868336|nr:PqiC family protein [Roseomonas nepalensis]
MRGARTPGRRGLALLGLALLPAACASPEPSLYRLLPAPGPVRRTRPLTVELRQVSVPGYLDRPEIIRAGEGARLRSLGNERWAEPLGDLLGSVLAENLALRLPDATVVTEGGALRAEGDVVVEVDVQRFEAGSANVVELVAQVSVRSRADRERRTTRVVRARRAATGPDTPALVGAMSAALGEVAEAVASMVRG